MEKFLLNYCLCNCNCGNYSQLRCYCAIYQLIKDGSNILKLVNYMPITHESIEQITYLLTLIEKDQVHKIMDCLIYKIDANDITIMLDYIDFMNINHIKYLIKTTMDNNIQIFDANIYSNEIAKHLLKLENENLLRNYIEIFKYYEKRQPFEHSFIVKILKISYKNENYEMSHILSNNNFIINHISQFNYNILFKNSKYTWNMKMIYLICKNNDIAMLNIIFNNREIFLMYEDYMESFDEKIILTNSTKRSKLIWKLQYNPLFPAIIQNYFEIVSTLLNNIDIDGIIIEYLYIIFELKYNEDKKYNKIIKFLLSKVFKSNYFTNFIKTMRNTNLLEFIDKNITQNISTKNGLLLFAMVNTTENFMEICDDVNFINHIRSYFHIIRQKSCFDGNIKIMQTLNKSYSMQFKNNDIKIAYFANNNAMINYFLMHTNINPFANQILMFNKCNAHINENINKSIILPKDITQLIIGLILDELWYNIWNDSPVD